jgi:hypothetical protein
MGQKRGSKTQRMMHSSSLLMEALLEHDPENWAPLFGIML